MAVCLGDLTASQQLALEDDSELASRIQIGLLPPRTQNIDGWEMSYHYQPAGTVSGDYCDLIRGDDNTLDFIVSAVHLPPLLDQENGVTTIEASGLPVGVFGTESFSVNRVQMKKGDTLFLYT